MRMGLMMMMWLATTFLSAMGFTIILPGSVLRTTTGKPQPLSATKLPEWNALPWPPNRGYGPNWSVDKLGNAVQKTGKCGALAWAIRGDNSTRHPELHLDLPVGQWLMKRRNLAICMSGGGHRAAVCALGWYRALHELGILKKARFIAANSGATWTTMPLCTWSILHKKETRQDIDYVAFLGKYTPPENIKSATSGLGTFGEVLWRADVKNYDKTTDSATRGPYNDWCDSIERQYLEPVLKNLRKGMSWKPDFWLDLSNAYLWNNQTILDEQHTMPFPVYVATAYDPTEVTFPIEFTNLYCGIPISPSCLGGGYIQGVGLNGKSLTDNSAVTVDETSNYMAEFDLPSPVVKICELTGASSCFAAAADTLLTLDLKKYEWILAVLGLRNFLGFLDPGKVKFWSPTSGGQPIDLSLVDGGLYDNLGVHAGLRRGCHTLIVCNAARVDVNDVKEDDWGSVFTDFACLFGSMRDLSYWEVVSKFNIEGLLLNLFSKEEFKAAAMNRKSQVFHSNAMESIVHEFKNLRMQNKPLVVRRTLDVIKNEFMGVFDERSVDFIFCFNGVSKIWEANLGSDAAKNAVQTKPFPFFKTTTTNYTASDVSMLAHLSSYTLYEGLKQVNFVVDDVPNEKLDGSSVPTISWI